MPKNSGLLGPVEVRTLAAELGIIPTKKLGQNFVIDPNTIRKIVEIGKVTDEDIVLEVGPGLGSLTLGLLGKTREVVAVELDGKLAAQLPATIQKQLPEAVDNIQVMHKDAVKVTELPSEPTAFVANLPYNVAVPIFLNILKRFSSITHGVVMVQKEVAQRLTASPSNKVYGVPTLKASWYAELKYAGTVGKNVFWPAPRIDSGLVFFERKANPYPEKIRDSVFELIDMAFSQRRKTIRTAINNWNKKYPERNINTNRLELDLSKRPEQLILTDFVAMIEMDNHATG
ncbi:MAG: 16S rRNA (adenine(1518)-N(6)/adenine(1519)-N(6))-dimethyltransferase RsmA [Micrococcaceae bacterium]